MKKTPKYLAGHTGECCALCGRNGCEDPLDTHHIFNGSSRRTSEMFHATVRLCHGRCHQLGKYSVHRNQDVDLMLKQYGERLMMEQYGWSVEDFRAMFGKNYLDEEMEDLDPAAMLEELQRTVQTWQAEDEKPEEEERRSPRQSMAEYAAELARQRRQRMKGVPEGCFSEMP